MKCTPIYKACPDYHPKEKAENRCQRDSNIGFCFREREAWEKEVDDFFLENNNSEIVY